MAARAPSLRLLLLRAGPPLGPQFAHTGWSARPAVAARSFAAEADATAASGGSKWWEQPGSCHELYKTMIFMLDKRGPQRPAALLELIRRVETPEDAERALKATKRFRQRRGFMGVNAALPPSHTTELTNTLLKVGRPDLAMDALSRAHELQLTPVRAAYHALMVHFAGAGQPGAMLGAYEALKGAGLRPTGREAYTLGRGFLDAGLPDAAKLTAAEFRRNGVKLPPMLEPL
eukprot:jgi/Tetstr1/421202/TSEL_001107.t1